MSILFESYFFSDIFNKEFLLIMNELISSQLEKNSSSCHQHQVTSWFYKFEVVCRNLLWIVSQIKNASCQKNVEWFYPAVLDPNEILYCCKTNSYHIMFLMFTSYFVNFNIPGALYLFTFCLRSGSHYPTIS